MSQPMSKMSSSSSSCKISEELELNGVVHSMAYCKDTHNVLLCDSFHWTIERLSHSSSGLSILPQKTLNLKEHLDVSNPTCVQITRRLSAIFIGCDSNEGISVVDQTSQKVIKRFAQNMNRDFDYMVVEDESDDTKCSPILYTSSTNSDLLTKLDYNSGSVLSELSVATPSNILLRDNKLFLICRIDSVECVLIIDKHSMKKRNKIVVSGWSSLGGLCLDGNHNVCTTARNRSKERIIYRFDDEGKQVGDEVKLCEFEEDAYVLDMVLTDYGLILAVQELGPEFFIKRVEL